MINPVSFFLCYIDLIFLSFLFCFCSQLMIVLGASLSFVIGTVITWRALALTGKF